MSAKVLYVRICVAYFRVFKSYLLLYGKDISNLQVRFFLRNAFFSNMMLCSAKVNRNLECFHLASSKISLNNVHISTQIFSDRTRCLWSSLWGGARYHVTNHLNTETFFMFEKIFDCFTIIIHTQIIDKKFKLLLVCVCFSFQK